MISILIPCYNYNAYNLVCILEKESLTLGIVFEVICIDDASFSNLNETNQKINTLTNCKFFESKKNIGRSANRQLLADKAQYNWLLFVDVDVTPLNSNFIEVYITEMKKEFKVNFDINYENKTKNLAILRYTFGKSREEIPSEIRNKNPYKYTISSNFLIKKKVFNSINKQIKSNSYGSDYLFGALLKNNFISINHIDNEATHHGLDENSKFLIKTKKALQNLYYLNSNKLIGHNDCSLLQEIHRTDKITANTITTFQKKLNQI